MAITRMDNVGIVVDDLDQSIGFFRELGPDLEGRATIERIGLAVSPGCATRRSRLP